MLVQYDDFQQALDAIAASGDVADELLFEKVQMAACMDVSSWPALSCEKRVLTVPLLPEILHLLTSRAAMLLVITREVLERSIQQA